MFLQNLVMAAPHALPSKPFVQFSTLVFAERLTSEDADVIEFNTCAPHSGFCVALERAHSRNVELIRLYTAQSRDEDQVKAIRDEAAKELEAFHRYWDVLHAVRDVLGCRAFSLHVTLDRDARTLRLAPPAVLSTDASDYPDHVRTTSEAMAHIAAHFNGGFRKVSLDWFTHNYPLCKLNMFLIDQHSFNPAQVRLNVDDLEEWDFLYPKFDEEISRYEA